MKVSKASVNYRRAPARGDGVSLRRCGRCSMFRGPGTCTLVAGLIERDYVCDRWEPKRSTVDTRKR